MFKIGDVVVCVGNDFTTSSSLYNTLTQGKPYTVTKIYNNHDFLNVLCDKGIEQRYWSKRFIPLSVYRKFILDRICSKLEMK